MSGYISPGVYIKETDLSTYIPALATTIVGMVGIGDRGPVNEATYISTEDQFIQTFGEPISYTTTSDGTFGSSMHTALEYLKQGRSLWYVRVGEDDAGEMAKAVIKSYSSGWTNDTTLTSRSNMGLYGYTFLSQITAEAGFTISIAAAEVGTGTTDATVETVTMVDNADGTFTLTFSGAQGASGDATYDGNFTDADSGTWTAFDDDGGNTLTFTVTVDEAVGAVVVDLIVETDTSAIHGEIYTLATNADTNYNYEILITTEDATAGTITVTEVDSTNFTITFTETITAYTWTSSNIAYAGGAQTVSLNGGVYVFTVTPSIHTTTSATWTTDKVSITYHSITITNHGFSTGVPVTLTTTSALPSGLVVGPTYYIRAVDDDTIAFYTSQALAEDTSVTTGLVELGDVGVGVGTVTLYEQITAQTIYNLQASTTIVIAAEAQEYGEYLNPTWDGTASADTNIETAYKIMFTFTNYTGVTYNLVKMVGTTYSVIESVPNLTFTDTTTMVETINAASDFITIDITGQLPAPSGSQIAYDVDALFFSSTGEPTYRKYTPFYTGIFKDGHNGVFDYDDGDVGTETYAISDVLMEAGDVIGTVDSITGVKTGLEIFSDVEKYDLNLITAPAFDPYLTDDGVAVKLELVALAEERRDCMAVIETPNPVSTGYNTPQQVVAWHNDNNFNSSYAALYYPWVKVYDSYAEAYIWVSPVGSALYTMALTDYTTYTWFAPAGLNRGLIPYAADLKYSASLGERDLLYGAIGSTTNVINPLVNFEADGIALWGQRTTQREPSALDRVNVRRMMLYIEKAIAKMSRYLLFEPNTPKLWTKFIDTVSPYLRGIQNAEGVYDWQIICDESTNTADVIDRNEMRAIIQIEPVKAAEIFVIDFQIMNTGTIANESILNL